VQIREVHAWDVTPKEAAAIQRRLRGEVVLADGIPLPAIRLVAGVDNAYRREGARTIAYATAIVLGFPALEVLETATAVREIDFPYVPGLLSFREAPAILDALRRLASVPDVLLFDGQGYAHRRRFGLASHLGVVLNRPTIGCAKSRLVGHFDEPEESFGARTPLVDRGEIVGAAVRTRVGHDPLFVSPGHLISIETAVAVVLACCRDGAFLPEPTRLAHDAVTAAAHPERSRNQ
jgi:deoxyribonuclease V